MRHYEIVALVHPDRSERAGDICGRIGDMVGKVGGKVHRIEDIGRRALAYPVLGLQKAHYLLLNVECSAEMHGQLGEYLKFNEDVLRSLIVRMDEAQTQMSTLLQQTRKEREQQSSDKRAPAEAKPEGEQAADAAGEGAGEGEQAAKSPKAEGVDAEDTPAKERTPS